jgi:hypothetical protein
VPGGGFSIADRRLLAENASYNKRLCLEGCVSEARGNRAAPTAAAAMGNNALRLDFMQPVAVVLQTFAVLVGISLTDFFDESKNKLPEGLQPWAFVAVVALLLRYIIGSAVHLNSTYGERTDDAGHKMGPLRQSRLFFLKDLAFLVAFGYVAIQMVHAHSRDYAFPHFMREAAWFVGLGLVWSIIDIILRSLLGERLRFKDDDKVSRLSFYWAALDAGQLFLTLIFLHWHGFHRWAEFVAAKLCLTGSVFMAIALAAIYVVCLIWDIVLMVSSRRRS